MPTAVVHFDGACSGNPGPMGAGAVLRMGERRQSLSKAMGRGTNNQAEYHGLIMGLLHAHSWGADEVIVRGDSQLVLRQLDGSYSVAAPGLKPLWEEARRLLGRFRSYRLEWVGRADNAEADRAARLAIETPAP